MGDAPAPPTPGATPPNPALDGHKLVYLTPFPENKAFQDRLAAKFPGLTAQHVRWDIWRQGRIPNKDDEAADPALKIDWSDVTVLVTGPAFPEVAQAPKLQYIQLQSAGANYVLDKPIFKDTDIAYCTANGVHGPQISEWVIGTYLAFQHQIPKYLDRQKQAKWQRDTDFLDDCVSQRVGILGYGAIGRQTARVAKALGMDVHAYTARPRTTPASKRDHAYCPPGLGDPDGLLPSKWFSGTQPEDINAFLTSGLDLLVIAVPLTPATHGMISTPQLKLLGEAAEGRGGKKCYVSNIGRGPVLDTDALIHALDEGWIRGAALDVTDPEPLTDGHPLWSKENVIITPHVSGGSTAYANRLNEILVENLERLAKGGEVAMLNRVDRGRGY